MGLIIPTAIPYHQIYKSTKNKLAFELARKSFWIGFIGSTVCLSITLPLVNMWYTKKRVLQEQSTPL